MKQNFANTKFPIHPVLFTELSKRKIKIEQISLTDILKISNEKTHDFIIQGFLPTVPYAYGLLIINKLNSSNYLKMKGFNAAKKRPVSFDTASIDSVVEEIGLPVLIKYESSLFTGKSSNPIYKRYDLDFVVSRMSENGQPLIAEEYIVGDIYSVFFSKQNYIHILKETSKRQFSLNKIDFSRDRDQVTSREFFEEEINLVLEKKLRSLAKKIIKLFNIPYFSFKVVVDSNSLNNIIILEIFHAATSHFGFEAKCKSEKKSVESIVADAIEEKLNNYAST